ncbi:MULTISPECIES: GMC oxidoreductase [unclassified Streptomyces]|uniref:GMC family oxidoreductase N-terminal domain-containing protein n=1 Tax=unclassified Streptomyces TaxID=2593676 RepID=UPI000DBACEBE|nr:MULTISPECIES: GMC oxidoreductase [unclassified Streptomyces]MYT73543.1 FAD-dependent oxidoreductase [Streptomyces sp. SID8367]RAJ85079.1 cholesterol oxidase [Streptomyces sp. PsTaAH-137]
MPTPSRRAVLSGAAGLAAAALPSRARASSAAPARVRPTEEEHRVVVIGSGFGGGVAALRLAQAGVTVTVLERGRRWPTGPNAETFPRVSGLDKRALWYGTLPEAIRPLARLIGTPLNFAPYAGLLEPVLGENILSVCAAGVGGGSLVYQGMTLQPSEAVFNTWLPAGLDYARMDRIHYPRVARMLQVATAPDALIDTPTYYAARTFAERARRAGYDVEKIPMPIDWAYAQAELRGEMKPSYTNGDCALGVNNGGKHSVDVTYLHQAEATGKVTVQTHHNVTSVARAADGRWEVSVDRTDDSGTVLEQKILTCRALIMAAGSVNTSKLLVRAGATGAIPDLPDGVGSGWGTNGDRIYAWTDLQEDFGKEQGGPVVYGSKAWDDPATANTVIQASLPPLGLDTRTTMLVGFGVSADRGQLRYDSSTDSVSLHWPRNGDTGSHRAIHRRVTEVSRGLGVLTDTNALVNSTWHPLGGAPMGTVCDLNGRVQGQKGLYVLDGALIPGTTGACNPSMTIAAVAERALDTITAQDIDTVI